MASPLLDWIRATAAAHVSESIDPLTASTSDSSDHDGSDVDRMIVARSAVPAAQTLVTLEHDAVLSGSAWLSALGSDDDDDSSSSAAAHKLRDELQQRQLSPNVLLALALLHECARKQQSRFTGYITQLPQRISLPLAWSESTRRKLKRTAAAPSIDAELVANVFASSVAPLANAFASLWPADVCTFARFEWAYAVVSSRAFRVGDNSTEPTLLPVIDMANHAAEDPAAEIVKRDDGSFQLVARRAIAEGEAVTISYGDLSNAELLCRYGFVLPTSVSSDCLLVRASELLATYAAFVHDDVANSDDDSDDDSDSATEPPASKKRRVFATAKTKAKRAATADAADDALFFRLHGDASKDFGLGDDLLSFVFAKSLPADVLYDVLTVLLRKRDKVYSRILEQEDAEGATGDNKREHALLQLLTKHERAVCRRVLIGILTLEENSSDDEIDSGDDAVSVNDDEDDDEDDEE